MSIIVKAGSDICKANTNTSTAKFQYSFSKAERFPVPNLAEKIRTKKLQDKLDKGETLPVKIRESHYHFYDLPSTKSTRRTTFGRGNKYDFTKAGNYCKASCYDPKTDFDKAHPHGPMYSFTKANRSGKGEPIKKKRSETEENKDENDKNKKIVDVDGPSPAVYNYLKPFGWDAPKFTMKGRHDDTKKEGKKEGQESEQKEDDKTKQYPQVTIQIRNTGKYVVSQIPNVNSLRFDKDKSKRTQFDANKNPGPKYNIPPLVCSKVVESQYRNYERIRISGRTNVKDSRSNYPGPGSYPIPSDFGQYESKDRDKYPKENVYVEERPKFEEKAWRHGMKKIEPKIEEQPEEQQGDQGDENNDETPGYNKEEENDNNNNEETPGYNKEDDKKEETPGNDMEEKKEEKKERKRSLGLVLIRGDSVISLSAESPPPENNNKRFNIDNKTIGVANPINRDIIPVTNPESGIGGLTSIGKGVGIPNMNELPNKNMVVPPKMTGNINTINTTIKPPIMPPPEPPNKGKKGKKDN